MRLVLCAGIPRSGSTWVYNAARLLLQREAAVHGAWVERWDEHDPAPVHLVKLHEPDEALADRADVILTSRRDLRDIAASALQRGWTSEADAVSFLERVVRLHAWWCSRSSWELAYEMLLEDPVAAVRELAGVLGADPGAAPAVRGEIDALREPAASAGWDERTLLHPEHLADGRAGYYRQVLPPALIDEINARFATWLQAHGYA